MNAPPRIKVLVVDDSAFARKVLRESLGASPEIEVIGTAGDGLEALEKISVLDPDVVTLDLMMPNLDGVGVLRELKSTRARARTVLVSFSGEDSELVVEGLMLGAFDLVKKPTALATDRLYELSSPLVKAVLEAARARQPEPVPMASPKVVSSAAVQTKLLVVGTSTGGPQALTRLLAGLPKDFPVPIAAALHIPAEYTAALARRLDDASALTVVEAADGMRLAPGTAVLARGGSQLSLVSDGETLIARVGSEPRNAPFAPSVDVLFRSAAKACGAATLGVVLTGMGDDGLEGSRAIVAAGGRVLNEKEETCVVYGMPKAVKDAGLAAGEARIEAMAEEIVRRL
ncbi:MAG: chemotaxis-specific protein-glutamate methyltransferase CheB [Myxococcaceae bacterium]